MYLELQLLSIISKFLPNSRFLFHPVSARFFHFMARPTMTRLPVLFVFNRGLHVYSAFATVLFSSVKVSDSLLVKTFGLCFGFVYRNGVVCFLSDFFVGLSSFRNISLYSHIVQPAHSSCALFQFRGALSFVREHHACLEGEPGSSNKRVLAGVKQLSFEILDSYFSSV